MAYDDAWGAVTFGKTDAELSRLIEVGVQVSTTPGTKYAYSNLGWALLGRVVERVSGMKFRDYVNANILRPLGMTSTVWEASDVPVERLATGYQYFGNNPVPEPRPSDEAFAPAGGLYTSLRDYARYAAYQLAAYPPRDDLESGPVRRSTLREMHEGQRWARGGDKDAPIARRSEDGIVLGISSYGYGWLNVTSRRPSRRRIPRWSRRKRHSCACWTIGIETLSERPSIRKVSRTRGTRACATISPSSHMITAVVGQKDR